MTPLSYWSIEVDKLTQELESSSNGLGQKAAEVILQRIGPNRIQSKVQITSLGLFLSQFKSPIVLILIAATLISAFLKDLSLIHI